MSAECFLSIRIIILPLQNSSPIMTISEQEIRCILVFSNTAVTYRPTGQLLNSESQSMHLLRKMSLKKGLLQHRLRHNNNKTIVINATVYYSLILATIWCCTMMQSIEVYGSNSIKIGLSANILKYLALTFVLGL